MSRPSQVLAWGLPFGLLIVAIVAVPLRVLEAEGLPRYRALKDELVEVRAANERLRQEVRTLDQQVTALRKDPAAIEHVARDELGMIRDGEVLFQFAE